jgi:hypothetical protein
VRTTDEVNVEIWNRYGFTPFQSRFAHALVTGRRL